jgi:hypothetical protein
MGCPNRSNPHKRISTLFKLCISRSKYRFLLQLVLLNQGLPLHYDRVCKLPIKKDSTLYTCRIDNDFCARKL